MTVQNASQYPKVFYCRHMQPGTAKYENETILVDSDGMKNLLASVGKRSIPVYVNHQNVDLKNIKQQADGYVTESFYNEMDGWGWFKFIAVDDQAHEAIKKGWSVSNAYTPTQWGVAGTKNNVPYNREVLNGEFTHLAIVSDPRYEGSMILTPEEFKNYQEEQRKKLTELQNSRLQNNSKEKKSMFKLFKNERKEVSTVDLDTCIELESGNTLTIREMVEAVVENSKAKSQKEQMVKVGDKEISLATLMENYIAIENAKKKGKKNEKEDEDKNEDEDGKEEEAGDDKKNKKKMKNKKEKKNDDGEEEDCMKNEGEEEEEEEKDKKKEKKNSKTIDVDKDPKYFEEMRNAHLKTAITKPNLVVCTVDQVQRGKDRYGSSEVKKTA